MTDYSIRPAQDQEETKKLINFLLVAVENITIAKTAAVFNRFFALRKLSELYSEALGHSISYERINQLIQKYKQKKGGEKS